ncbi:MAG: hypothetical protein R2860_08950 [Desulfobacterales bacterium]
MILHFLEGVTNGFRRGHTVIHNPQNNIDLLDDFRIIFADKGGIAFFFQKIKGPFTGIIIFGSLIKMKGIRRGRASGLPVSRPTLRINGDFMFAFRAPMAAGLVFGSLSSATLNLALQLSQTISMNVTPERLKKRESD